MSLKHVRMSRKNHPLPIEGNPQRKGRYTGAPKVGEDLKDTPSTDSYIWKTYPLTGRPLSNEMPSRGEGPQRNVRSKSDK